MQERRREEDKKFILEPSLAIAKVKEVIETRKKKGLEDAQLTITKCNNNEWQ
jgi:hypothetical protein